MKFEKLSIATARIHGLNECPYYFEAKCYYAWDITFSDTSTSIFNNLAFIKLGDTKEEAEVLCNQLKENFKRANIFDGCRVAVIFGEDCTVRAIAPIREDRWIDVRDLFTPKTFAELDIIITSLEVY